MLANGDNQSAQISDWDPDVVRRVGDLSKPAQIRIKKDLKKFIEDPPLGICVAPSSNDIGRVYAFISGPTDTPYEGGYFLFVLAFPDDYPLSPPRVKMLNTGGGSVRFGPNLYANGKVCLSIIGTWSGPQWTPTQNLLTVLVSIQSLMNAEPYYNEPGFEGRPNSMRSKLYNKIIVHETLRCAVCDVMEKKIKFPEELCQIIQLNFLEQYEDYLNICKTGLRNDGQAMSDPFGGSRGHFQYGVIQQRLERIHDSF